MKYLFQIVFAVFLPQFALACANGASTLADRAKAIVYISIGVTLLIYLASRKKWGLFALFGIGFMFLLFSYPSC